MRRDLCAPLFALAVASCGAPGAPPQAVSALSEQGISELEVQALVMQMADEYSAAIAETTYLTLRKEALDPSARWLGLSFLRNGMGAALDIAAGPNPDVALLDLLVLASLQTWAFERNWVPAGISEEASAAAVAKLHAAEQGLWVAARRVLSPENETTLRELIAEWIEAHPDQTVVSLVRFADFTQGRLRSTAGSPGRAQGLLRQVGQATAAVEDARLLGERALWFASRYPYLLGQQAELTAYRIADQPEVRAAVDAAGSLHRLADTLGEQLDDLEAQEEQLFARLGAERVAAIEQLERSLAQVVDGSIEELTGRLDVAREAAVEHVFERFAQEREALFARLDVERAELDDTLALAHDTALALGATTEAADRLLERFDRDPASGREPLRLDDLRVTAVEAHAAAERATEVLDRVDAMAASDEWAARVEGAGSAAHQLANALFWRGAALIALLIGGLALLRRVPRR